MSQQESQQGNRKTYKQTSVVRLKTGVREQPNALISSVDWITENINLPNKRYSYGSMYLKRYKIFYKIWFL